MILNDSLFLPKNDTLVPPSLAPHAILGKAYRIMILGSILQLSALILYIFMDQAYDSVAFNRDTQDRVVKTLH